MLWYNHSDLLLDVGGDYALYVWGAIVVAVVLVVAEQVLLTIRRNSILEYLGVSRKN